MNNTKNNTPNAPADFTPTLGDYNYLQPLRYWCNKILPMVYDDSLSYYEVLCKVVDYINQLIENDKIIYSELESLKNDLKEVQNWIDNFDTSFIQREVAEYIAKTIKAVTFGISSDGYFMAIIPSNWSDIEFGTIQSGELYGHLTLSYD